MNTINKNVNISDNGNKNIINKNENNIGCICKE